MKKIFTFIILTVSTVLLAQKIDYNVTDGYVAEGFDLVSYFTDKKPSEGIKKHQTIYDGTKFKFSSEKNLNLFKENPLKYIPQYGGYCAYAIAEKNKKMYIDPEVYEIRDGKLYLFYSSWIGSKLGDWQEGDVKKRQTKGDNNWKKLKYKK